VKNRFVFCGKIWTEEQRKQNCGNSWVMVSTSKLRIRLEIL
jgi:hypothetical protein